MFIVNRNGQRVKVPEKYGPQQGYKGPELESYTGKNDKKKTPWWVWLLVAMIIVGLVMAGMAYMKKKNDTVSSMQKFGFRFY